MKSLRDDKQDQVNNTQIKQVPPPTIIGRKAKHDQIHDSFLQKDIAARAKLLASKKPIKLLR